MARLHHILYGWACDTRTGIQPGTGADIVGVARAQNRCAVVRLFAGGADRLRVGFPLGDLENDLSNTALCSKLTLGV